MQVFSMYFKHGYLCSYKLQFFSHNIYYHMYMKFAFGFSTYFKHGWLCSYKLQLFSHNSYYHVYIRFAFGWKHGKLYTKSSVSNKYKDL
jgi:hypothetical protein